jgi:hypothetical protein
MGPGDQQRPSRSWPATFASPSQSPRAGRPTPRESPGPPTSRYSPGWAAAARAHARGTFDTTRSGSPRRRPDSTFGTEYDGHQERLRCAHTTGRPCPAPECACVAPDRLHTDPPAEWYLDIYANLREGINLQCRLPVRPLPRSQPRPHVRLPRPRPTTSESPGHPGPIARADGLCVVRMPLPGMPGSEIQN